MRIYKLFFYNNDPINNVSLSHPGALWANLGKSLFLCVCVRVRVLCLRRAAFALSQVETFDQLFPGEMMSVLLFTEHLFKRIV